MAHSVPYLKHDLCKLGYANQRMIERIYGFWSSQLELNPSEDGFDPRDHSLPPLLRKLILGVTSQLQYFSKKELGEQSQKEAKCADLLLTKAWRAYQRRWQVLSNYQNARAMNKKNRKISEELLDSALKTKEWSNFRESFSKFTKTLGGELARWVELGSLISQVETLWEMHQPRILGEKYPIPALQDALREVLGNEPSFSDLNIELHDKETDFHGIPHLKRVQKKIRNIYGEMLDRLAKKDEEGNGNAGPLTQPTKKAENDDGKGGRSAPLLLTSKPEEGEGNGVAGTGRNKTGYGKRGRKKLLEEEEKRRNDILSEWDRAHNAGIARKTFCRDHTTLLKVVELEKFYAWKKARNSRKTQN